jgi:hypothetical protein
MYHGDQPFALFFMDWVFFFPTLGYDHSLRCFQLKLVILITPDDYSHIGGVESKIAVDKFLFLSPAGIGCKHTVCMYLEVT